MFFRGADVDDVTSGSDGFSPQNPGTKLSKKKHLVMSRMVWFLHFAMPFW